MGVLTRESPHLGEATPPSPLRLECFDLQLPQKRPPFVERCRNGDRNPLCKVRKACAWSVDEESGFYMAPIAFSLNYAFLRGTGLCLGHELVWGGGCLELPG